MAVGSPEGLMDWEGLMVGSWEGLTDGSWEGLIDGSRDGRIDGSWEGLIDWEGLMDGSREGLADVVGAWEGLNVLQVCTLARNVPSSLQVS